VFEHGLPAGEGRQHVHQAEELFAEERRLHRPVHGVFLPPSHPRRRRRQRPRPAQKLAADLAGPPLQTLIVFDGATVHVPQFYLAARRCASVLASARYHAEMKRGTLIAAPVVFMAIAAGGMLYPIHGAFSKLATILGLLGFIGSAAALVWRRKLLRIGLGVALAGASLVFCMPGGAVHRDSLRGRYVANLRSYEGTRYVWGGEGGRGIDCSGLPRRAYRDALLAEGLCTLNGRLTRHWMEQWWNDAGAKDMAAGADGRLVKLPGPDAARPEDGLEAGDVAVVNGDTHVLVYLGGGTWMEADPDAGKVIVHDGHPGGRSSLGVSPKILRWSELAEAN
jgi:hypothetical protein